MWSFVTGILLNYPYNFLEVQRGGFRPRQLQRHKQDYAEKQSLKGLEFDLIMSAVALNVCKNYPGQLVTFTAYSHKHTHTKHLEAA